jgi:hypothetical protein
MHMTCTRALAYFTIHSCGMSRRTHVFLFIFITSLASIRTAKKKLIQKLRFAYLCFNSNDHSFNHGSVACSCTQTPHIITYVSHTETLRQTMSNDASRRDAMMGRVKELVDRAVHDVFRRHAADELRSSRDSVSARPLITLPLADSHALALALACDH